MPFLKIDLPALLAIIDPFALPTMIFIPKLHLEKHMHLLAIKYFLLRSKSRNIEKIVYIDCKHIVCQAHQPKWFLAFKNSKSNYISLIWENHVLTNRLRQRSSIVCRLLFSTILFYADFYSLFNIGDLLSSAFPPDWQKWSVHNVATTW